MNYRELRRKLREHGIEEDVGQGKGSHRTFYNGEVSLPIPFHGENADVKPCYVKKLEQKFDISLR